MGPRSLRAATIFPTALKTTTSKMHFLSRDHRFSGIISPTSMPSGPNERIREAVTQPRNSCELQSRYVHVFPSRLEDPGEAGFQNWEIKAKCKFKMREPEIIRGHWLGEFRSLSPYCQTAFTPRCLALIQGQWGCANSGRESAQSQHRWSTAGSCVQWLMPPGEHRARDCR
jgi:hypothetical protein